MLSAQFCNFSKSASCWCSTAMLSSVIRVVAADQHEEALSHDSPKSFTASSDKQLGYCSTGTEPPALQQNARPTCSSCHVDQDQSRSSSATACSLDWEPSVWWRCWIAFIGIGHTGEIASTESQHTCSFFCYWTACTTNKGWVKADHLKREVDEFVENSIINPLTQTSVKIDGKACKNFNSKTSDWQSCIK